MTARILLVRHGRSAHNTRGWHAAAGVAQWMKHYDSAGLLDGELPPASLVELAGAADVIVASDLPRAAASALLLAPDRAITSSALLREADMPVPPMWNVRLPLMAWSLLIGSNWALGRRRGVIPSPALRQQARDAAVMLSNIAGDEQVVLAMTHATIRSLIAEALESTGWKREPGGERFAHWGAWSLLPSVRNR